MASSVDQKLIRFAKNAALEKVQSGELTHQKAVECIQQIEIEIKNLKPAEKMDLEQLDNRSLQNRATNMVERAIVPSKQPELYVENMPRMEPADKKPTTEAARQEYLLDNEEEKRKTRVMKEETKENEFEQIKEDILRSAPRPDINRQLDLPEPSYQQLNKFDKHDIQTQRQLLVAHQVINTMRAAQGKPLYDKTALADIVQFGKGGAMGFPEIPGTVFHTNPTGKIEVGELPGDIFKAVGEIKKGYDQNKKTQLQTQTPTTVQAHEHDETSKPATPTPFNTKPNPLKGK